MTTKPGCGWRRTGSGTLIGVDTPLEIPVDQVDLASWRRILDVRPHASDSARIPGSEPAALADIAAIDAASPHDRILVVCDVGMRSRVGAAALQSAGFLGARSMAGGIEAWRRAGLPLEHTGGLGPDDLERYDRQIKLPGFGVRGQAALGNASVMMVGAGGLGSPVLSYLAGAGIGSLTVIDDDVVAVSNLHRQPVFATKDEGLPKAEAAKRFAEALNPSVAVHAVTTRLAPENATSLLAGADVIIDASDNHPTRHLVNDAAIRLGVPLVTGAVYRYEGRVLTVSPPGPCYRCAFPNEPHDSAATDCSIVGVLGSVVGTIGSMMATAAMSMLIDREGSQGGRLVVFDGTMSEDAGGEGTPAYGLSPPVVPSRTDVPVSQRSLPRRGGRAVRRRW